MPKIWPYLSVWPDCRNMTLFLFSLPTDGYTVPSQSNAFNNYLIFLVKSGKGAIFTIGSFFLILYLSDKIWFTGKQKLILAALCLPYYVGWWFIKTTEYNTNTPGMIELGLFLLICLGLEEGKRRYPKVQFWFMAIEIFLEILGMGVARHFQARSGFYGFLVFLPCISWSLCWHPEGG